MLLGETPALRELNVRTFRPVLMRKRTVYLRPLIYGKFGTSFSKSRVTIRMPLSLRTRTRTHLLVFSRVGLLSPTVKSPVSMPARSVLVKLCMLADKGHQNVYTGECGPYGHAGSGGREVTSGGCGCAGRPFFYGSCSTVKTCQRGEVRLSDPL